MNDQNVWKTKVDQKLEKEKIEIVRIKETGLNIQSASLSLPLTKLNNSFQNANPSNMINSKLHPDTTNENNDINK